MPVRVKAVFESLYFRLCFFLRSGQALLNMWQSTVLAYKSQKPLQMFLWLAVLQMVQKNSTGPPPLSSNTLWNFFLLC